ncbi:MAG TPA: MFS transporter [Solirubrobacteraceae bacterium]|nr:MFS transporter [Solirubrobacteraceae bacterium]
MLDEEQEGQLTDGHGLGTREREPAAPHEPAGGDLHDGAPRPAWLSRQLTRYPNTGMRVWYLAITVAVTVVLYYELYIQGAVATKVIQHFGFTFTEFVVVLVVGNAVGAFGSLFAGIADRWGRANLVVGGLLLSGLLVTFALPNAASKGWYLAFFALLSVVEGVALVATPALIRDFSPQLGRAAAMAFWTMGPVLGSLLVTEISSHTLASHPDWQYQFRLCGIIGLAVWLVAFIGMRELSPQLRDQRMVSMRDRALIEARAAGIKPDELLRGQWRQMLKPDVIGSALGISVFLMLYYVFVAFLVVYFVTVFGYTEARSNDLGNWYWIANVVALLVAGFASDALRVRKPMMIVGALISVVGVALFATAATEPKTGFHTFAAYFIIIAVGSGIAYVSWMAAFTETVERRNPAATATGLAIWGWIIRIVVTVSFAVLPSVVPATSTLVDHGARVKQIVASYPAQTRVLQTVHPATLAALKLNPANRAAQASAISQLTGVPPARVAQVALLGERYSRELVVAAALTPATQAALASEPTSPAALQAAVREIAAGLHITPAQASAELAALGRVPRADLALLRIYGPTVTHGAAALRSLSAVPAADVAYLAAHGGEVAKASHESPGQWQTWWWICFAAQLVFIPTAFLLTGRWNPRRARQDEIEHDRRVEHELELLQAETAVGR